MISLTANALNIPEQITQVSSGYSMYTTIACTGAILLTAEIIRRLSLQFKFYASLAKGDAMTLRNLSGYKFDLHKGPFPMNRLIKIPPLLFCLHNNKAPSSIAKFLINENNVSITEKGWCGFSALQLACKRNTDDLVNLLLEKGIDPNSVDDFGDTAVHTACLKETKKEISEAILKDPRADINALTKTMDTPLIIASIKGNVTAAKILIEQGANPNLPNFEGKTPLYYAASYGNTELASVLLDHPSINLNLTSQDGYTALSIACLKRNWEVVKLLIEKGADLNFKGRFDDTIFNYVIDDTEFAKYIIDQPGVDLNLKNSRGYTPFSLAGLYKQTEIMNLLLDKGVQLDAADAFGNNALHIVCSNGNRELVNKILDKQNIDLNAVNQEGETPLILTCRYNQEEIAKLLIEKGANVLIQSTEKRTALQSACFEGNFEVCKLLLEKGADPNVRSRNSGYTSLNVAIMLQRADLVKLLLENGAKMEECSWSNAPMFQGLFSLSVTRELLSKYPLRYVVATPLLCFMPVAMLMKFAFDKVVNVGSRTSNKIRPMLTTINRILRLS